MSLGEREGKRLAELEKALARWEEALSAPPSEMARDSAILCFELVYELEGRVLARVDRRGGYPGASGVLGGVRRANRRRGRCILVQGDPHAFTSGFPLATTYRSTARPIRNGRRLSST